MLNLDQEIYVIIKQYGIKKKESSHQIAGIFLPDSTSQAMIHHIIEIVQHDSGNPYEPKSPEEKGGEKP